MVVEHVMEGALFCNPKTLLAASFWDNTFLKRANKTISHRTFPELVHKVKKVADFFQPGTTDFLTLENFRERFNVDLDGDKFTDIECAKKYGIEGHLFSGGNLLDFIKKTQTK